MQPAHVAGSGQSLVAKDVLDVSETISELRAASPDYIGIGNSMLFTRLGYTPTEMNALTGKKFFYVFKNGSASAMWYLTLKNVVAASGVHPKLVFFFIRDNDLTSPFFRTQGQSASYLNSLRGPEEPLLDKLLELAPEKTGLVGTVSRWLDGPGGLFHFPAWDEKTSKRLINLSMDLGTGRTPKGEMRSLLMDRFAVKHLRKDVASDLPPADSRDDGATDIYNDVNKNFRHDPEEHSFLPAMMRVAREHGIKLLFFRIKRRPDEQGTVSYEPPELRPYTEHLKQWIEERGGLFFDESYDPAITLQAYQDGDHIGTDHGDWYRKYFWKRMAPLFP